MAIELEGQRWIGLERPRVWRALIDAQVLQAAIPGCHAMRGTAETGYEADIALDLKLIRARFTSTLELQDLRPLQGYLLCAEGSGGLAGFGRGEAVIDLSDDAGGTLLRYEVTARPGGRLAALGGRALTGLTAKLAEKFLDRFVAQL